MKVSELTGPDLARWVAKARRCIVSNGNENTSAVGEPIVGGVVYRPDLKGGQCFDLIEEFNITVSPNAFGQPWRALCHSCKNFNEVEGAAPQEAICRAVDASVYGDEVDDERE